MPNDMRDGLIELLRKVECVGEESFLNCPERRNGHCRSIHRLEMCQIGAIADYLISNGASLLPCDIGDRVYFIKCFFDYAKQPMCGTVCMIKTFTGKGSWTFGAIINETIERHFVSCDIGKTVFLTREEAEKALKERENK